MPSKMVKKEVEEEPAPLVIISDGKSNDDQIRERHRESSINKDDSESEEENQNMIQIINESNIVLLEYDFNLVDYRSYSNDRLHEG